MENQRIIESSESEIINIMQDYYFCNGDEKKRKRLLLRRKLKNLSIEERKNLIDLFKSNWKIKDLKF
jgi:hypothetical protein